MSHSAKTVVTLVHGTFARRAKWVQSSSLIYRELTKNLPAPVVITAFGWSGRNSASARERAAEELAAQLRQRLSEYPSAQHVLIGHSHGGNVALKAVMIANLSDAVRVVCLSTPFFNVTPRNYGGTRETAAIFTGLGLCVTATWVYLYSRVFPDWQHQGPFPVFSSLPFLMVIGFVWSRCYKAADSIAESFRVAIPATTKLLIVRTVGDEATSFLAAFQFGGWLLTACIRKYVSTAATLHELSQRLQTQRAFKSLSFRIFATLFPLGALLLLVFHPLSKVGSAIVAAVALIPLLLSLLAPLAFMTGAAVLMSIACLAPFAVGIVTLAVLPMGLDSLIMTLFYEVTVESVPTGEWAVNQVVPQHMEQLNHSATYDDPNVVKTIQEWLFEQAH
jgi:hypothetical protein